MHDALKREREVRQLQGCPCELITISNSVRALGPYRRFIAGATFRYLICAFAPTTLIFVEGRGEDKEGRGGARRRVRTRAGARALPREETASIYLAGRASRAGCVTGGPMHGSAAAEVRA